MPLRVPSCGQPGYWFHPAWTIAENTKFELIVEGRPGEVRAKSTGRVSATDILPSRLVVLSRVLYLRTITWRGDETFRMDDSRRTGKWASNVMAITNSTII